MKEQFIKIEKDHEELISASKLHGLLIF